MRACRSRSARTSAMYCRRACCMCSRCGRSVTLMSRSYPILRHTIPLFNHPSSCAPCAHLYHHMQQACLQAALSEFTLLYHWPLNTPPPSSASPFSCHPPPIGLWSCCLRRRSGRRQRHTRSSVGPRHAHGTAGATGGCGCGGVNWCGALRCACEYFHRWEWSDGIM